jgi:hypothetical protein
MTKISETQVAALRLASEVPTCLSDAAYSRATIRALERRGLVESYGSETLGDGYVVTRYGITEVGRLALSE